MRSNMKGATGLVGSPCRFGGGTSSSSLPCKNVVVVVIDMSVKEWTGSSEAAVTWSLNTIMQGCDHILLLGVLDPLTNSMKASGFLGYKLKTAADFMEEAAKKKIKIESKTGSIRTICFKKGVHLEVEVKVGPPKLIAVQVATSLRASWVVLNRSLKKDAMFFMDQLSCGIIRMRQNNEGDILRVPQEGPEKPEDMASEGSDLMDNYIYNPDNCNDGSELSESDFFSLDISRSQPPSGEHIEYHFGPAGNQLNYTREPMEADRSNDGLEDDLDYSCADHDSIILVPKNNQTDRTGSIGYIGPYCAPQGSVLLQKTSSLLSNSDIIFHVNENYTTLSESGSRLKFPLADPTSTPTEKILSPASVLPQGEFDEGGPNYPNDPECLSVKVFSKDIDEKTPSIDVHKESSMKGQFDEGWDIEYSGKAYSRDIDEKNACEDSDIEKSSKGRFVESRNLANPSKIGYSGKVYSNEKSPSRDSNIEISSKGPFDKGQHLVDPDDIKYSEMGYLNEKKPSRDIYIEKSLMEGGQSASLNTTVETLTYHLAQTHVNGKDDYYGVRNRSPRHPQKIYGAINRASSDALSTIGNTLICSVCKQGSPIFSQQPKWFTLSELKLATVGFSQESFIAEGEFGLVFKGVLKERQAIAIKQHKYVTMQEDMEFCSEVELLSCVQHRNLVKLLGYCQENDQRILVYEYVCNRTLAWHLSLRNPTPLEWWARHKIAIGTAHALRYLHEECHIGCIVHRDLRPSNILLTHEFEPMVGDFGLARFQLNAERSMQNRGIGTFGYLAPEYAESGQVSWKSDVYSFGVILLELISGRMAFDHSRPPAEQNLIEWAQSRLNSNRYYELLDHRLHGSCIQNELRYMARAAYFCIRRDPSTRPRISQVLSILEGETREKMESIGSPLASLSGIGEIPSIYSPSESLSSRSSSQEMASLKPISSIKTKNPKSSTSIPKKPRPKLTYDDM